MPPLHEGHSLGWYFCTASANMPSTDGGTALANLPASFPTRCKLLLRFIAHYRLAATSWPPCPCSLLWSSAAQAPRNPQRRHAPPVGPSRQARYGPGTCCPVRMMSPAGAGRRDKRRRAASDYLGTGDAPRTRDQTHRVSSPPAPDRDAGLAS